MSIEPEVLPIISGISYHHVRIMSARKHEYPDAPITITVHSDYEHDYGSEITLYLDDPILTGRLVAGINEICEARRKELEAPDNALSQEQRT